MVLIGLEGIAPIWGIAVPEYWPRSEDTGDSELEYTTKLEVSKGLFPGDECTPENIFSKGGSWGYMGVRVKVCFLGVFGLCYGRSTFLIR